MNCIAEVFKSFDEVRVVYFVQGLSKKEGRVVINEERIEGTELGALGRVLGVFDEVWKFLGACSMGEICSEGVSVGGLPAGQKQLWAGSWWGLAKWS